jgi:hypothetical protein
MYIPKEMHYRVCVLQFDYCLETNFMEPVAFHLSGWYENLKNIDALNLNQCTWVKNCLGRAMVGLKV